MARSVKVGKRYLHSCRYDQLLFSEFQLFRKYYETPCILKVKTLKTLSDVLEGRFFPESSQDLPSSTREALLNQECLDLLDLESF